jgi:response regulator RpfG family c-di-GMP phosphodiesterase
MENDMQEKPVIEKILFVDDDDNLLSSLQRTLGKEFDIVTAPSGEAGITEITRNGPFAVIVSDFRMPVMDGIQFLSKAREISQKSVRMLLTGHADLNTAIEAVNRGSIFRLLIKPCPIEQLKSIIDEGIAQYRLIMAEKDLLEKTLRYSIKVLSDILSLVNPKAFSHASRVRRLVKQLAEDLKLEKTWQLEIAAMLSQIGCVAIPEETLAKVFEGKPLSSVENAMYQSYPQVGGDLIANIPRMAKVAEIIRYQELRYDGGGHSADVPEKENIPIESRILKLALDYDKFQGSGMAVDEAFIEVKKKESWYDPNVFKALERVMTREDKFEIRDVALEELSGKMIFSEDVIADNGALLVSKGEEVTTSMVYRLRNFSKTVGLKNTFKVIIIKD